MIQPILLEQFPVLNDQKNNKNNLEDNLAQIIMHKPQWTTPWMCNLILLELYSLKSKHLVPVIEKSLTSTDWVVLDAALWLAGRVLAKQRAQEFMLNVPTRYLVQHRFQEFLEGKEHADQ